jgi:hypothetical protein
MMSETPERKAYIKEWQARNKDRCLETNRAWKQRNKEHCQAYFKEWAKSNPEVFAASHVKATESYRKRNTAAYSAYAAKRRALELKATPNWANLAAIEIEYKLSAWCSSVMGQQYHVDHIIPLKGKNVCGLHVESNLQVIPARVNQSKHNKFVAA